jgi:nucleoside-diphosphate-sugar epimerase
VLSQSDDQTKEDFYSRAIHYAVLMDSKSSAIQKIAKELDNKSLLITGGTGFVGRSLISLIQKISFTHNISIKCHIASRSPENWRPIAYASGFSASHLKIDLLDPSSSLPEVDLVVHAAMPQPALINTFSPMDMLLASVTSTKTLLDNFRIWKTPPRLLFTSSGAVYGESIDARTKWSERSRVAHQTFMHGGAYGEGKRVAEMLLSIAAEENLCASMIARMFTFSGQHLPLDEHFAIGNFVKNALSGHNILINHDGKAIRTYLDSEDMAIWLLIILLYGQSSRAYHVGSQDEISIKELADLVADRSEVVLGYRPAVSILNNQNTMVQFDRYVPSTSITRSALKISEWTSLTKSIDLMLTTTKTF